MHLQKRMCLPYKAQCRSSWSRIITLKDTESVTSCASLSSCSQHVLVVLLWLRRFLLRRFQSCFHNDHQMKTQPVSGWICVALVFWVLGGGDGVAFWSRGKPLHSRKQPPEEAQPASRMVCIMATRREEWGMVQQVGLTFRKGNVQ